MTDLADPRTLRVLPITAPASLDAADAGPFLDMVRLANEACRHDAGHDYLDEDPQEVLGFWQDQADWTQLGFAAVRDGAVLGAARLRLATEADARTIEADILVDPEHWGEGIEEMLLEVTERVAHERGRSIVQSWTLHRPDAGGPPLAPSTGWGAVPATDRQTVFMTQNGFSLEQVERNSTFDLHGSFDTVERMRAEAATHAGDDYRVVTWISPTPERYLDSFAQTISRMSTDAPQGGLVIEEEHWDAARVRRRDARLKAQGLLVSVVGVEHVPTGTIAAYNELVIGSDRSAATSQYGTLVLKEHRGRRLGTIVKCEGLLRWRDLVPESPRVSTFNAEENRPMLDINEAIGFVPVSYAGAWKKVVD